VPRNFTSKTPTNKRKIINSISKTREWKGEWGEWGEWKEKWEEREEWKVRGIGK